MVFFSLSPARKAQVERRCSSGSLRRRSGPLRKVAARVSTPRAGCKESGIAEAFGFEPEAQGVMETTDALLFSGEPIHYITDRAVGAVREKLDSWKTSGRWQRCVRFDVGDKEDEKPEPKRNRCRANACDDLESLVAAHEAKSQSVEESPEIASDLAVVDKDASETADVGDASDDAAQVAVVGAPLVGRSPGAAGDESEAAQLLAVLVLIEPEVVVEAEVGVPTGRKSRRVHFDEATVKEEVAPFVGARPRANTVFDLDAWVAGETA